MKKIKIKVLFFSVSVLCFMAFGPVYAAPCYGTKLPRQKKIFSGLQTHVIKKRHLEHDAGNLRSTQHFLLLSYGILDWLSLDLKGGFGDIKRRPFQGDSLNYPSFLAGGYGLRFRFYDFKNTKMVFGFQHISVHPDTISIGTGKNKAVLDDWQFSLLASTVFKKITPYSGLKWSRTDYIHWVDNQRERVKSDLTESIGLVCGLDFEITEKIWLNLESQVLGSTAFSCSVNYSF
jgi:hypothetical protein